MGEVEIVAACTCTAERNLVIFGFFTGLRVSELIALKWTDADLDAGVLQVQRALVEGKEKNPRHAPGGAL